MEGRKHGKYAIMKDAPIMPEQEEFVFGMGQRKNDKSAIMKDAPALPRKEDFAIGIGRRTKVLSARTPTMPRPNEKLEPPLRKV